MYTVFYILYVIWYILNSLQLRIRRVRILFSRKTLSGNYRVSWLFSYNLKLGCLVTQTLNTIN
jgi:hypothetical protein